MVRAVKEWCMAIGRTAAYFLINRSKTRACLIAGKLEHDLLHTICRSNPEEALNKSSLRGAQRCGNPGIACQSKHWIASLRSQ
jgi:hypothetical protein